MRWIKKIYDQGEPGKGGVKLEVVFSMHLYAMIWTRFLRAVQGIIGAIGYRDNLSRVRRSKFLGCALLA